MTTLRLPAPAAALHRSVIPTPLGDLAVVWEESAVRALNFTDSEPPLWAACASATAAPAPAWIAAPLAAYFGGDVTALRDVPVRLEGTPFQRRVWEMLGTIPAGETRTYGDLAARLGRPAASRAVGAANGANPVSLVVPCHRVIGAKGALTGYAHGVDRKRWLLHHEGALA